MTRKQFLKGLVGSAIFMKMDGFSTVANALSHGKQDNNIANDFATYGAIHLNNTDLKKATHFWTQVVGMKERKRLGKMVEFGTEKQTIVVVHESAKKKYQKGYSGLYHFAIHAPNIEEFASMINRLHHHNYPYSPIDHTMSKSVYLDDPDGINIEFTLETPERFKRVVTTRGLQIEGTDGILRSASERLDVSKVLRTLINKDVNKTLDNGSYIGHVHLYANNVVNSNVFYKSMGFLQFNYLPEFTYADLGAGGDYQHRIVMNSWHGQNRPIAPEGSAGMRHFQINFKNQEKITQAMAHIKDYEERDGGYWFKDPTGNQIFLKQG